LQKSSHCPPQTPQPYGPACQQCGLGAVSATTLCA
jgi:hypothetical protein